MATIGGETVHFGAMCTMGGEFLEHGGAAMDARSIQTAFLRQMRTAAAAAGHKWPGAAAAEAWVETGGVHWPAGSCNVLGIKAFHGWTGATCGAKGTEQGPDGCMTEPSAMRWAVFPSLTACFAEQMKILHEPRYAAALAAATVEDYIREEGRVWSTGILKGEAVWQTYRAHRDVLEEAK